MDRPWFGEGVYLVGMGNIVRPDERGAQPGRYVRNPALDGPVGRFMPFPTGSAALPQARAGSNWMGRVELGARHSS